MYLAQSQIALADTYSSVGVPACRVAAKLAMIGPGGTVKSLTAVEKTVGTVSAPGPETGSAIRPMLAQIALTG